MFADVIQLEATDFPGASPFSKRNSHHTCILNICMHTLKWNVFIKPKQHINRQAITSINNIKRKRPNRTQLSVRVRICSVLGASRNVQQTSFQNSLTLIKSSNYTFEVETIEGDRFYDRSCTGQQVQLVSREYRRCKNHIRSFLYQIKYKQLVTKLT